MNILEIKDVDKRIGSRKIVENLTMSVQEGEVFGFLGPNGAGKTTTIRMIVGLIRPTKGSITICGHDIAKQRAHALSNVGTIVENPETYGYLTGYKNLVHYARLAGLQDFQNRISEVIELVGLTDRMHDKVKRYSLGMRQRLGLAQALLAHPKLLVLDEPTNGLDPAGMREFRELMRRLAKEEGMSVFVSSHLLGELEQMCDKVAIIQSGRIVTQQAMESLITGTAKAIQIAVHDANLAVQILQKSGVTASIQRENNLLVQAPPEKVPEIIRALVAGNIDIFSVEPTKESLETTFLDLTANTNKPLHSSSAQATIGGETHA